MQPPTLSLAERDRRWANVRKLMRERGFDGLLVAGFRSREMYETYISDDYNEGCVIFPLEGDPVVITWAYLRVMRARWSQERGATLWVGDYRVATSGTGVAEVLREKHLAESNLGVVGLSSQAPTEIYGAIPANFWMELTAALPKARWQDISEEFSHLMLVKSDEELAQVRYAARAAEAACKVIAEVAAPGVGEEVVFAEGTAEMLRHGIGVRYPVIVMNSGPHTLSWGPPRWTTSGEAPRILQRGDLMQAELMPLCGNQEVQVQMTVALDPLDDTNKQCERVALGLLRRRHQGAKARNSLRRSVGGDGGAAEVGRLLGLYAAGAFGRAAFSGRTHFGQSGSGQARRALRRRQCGADAPGDIAARHGVRLRAQRLHRHAPGQYRRHGDRHRDGMRRAQSHPDDGDAQAIAKISSRACAAKPCCHGTPRRHMARSNRRRSAC